MDPQLFYSGMSSSLPLRARSRKTQPFLRQCPSRSVARRPETLVDHVAVVIARTVVSFLGGAFLYTQYGGRQGKYTQPYTLYSSQFRRDHQDSGRGCCPYGYPTGQRFHEPKLPPRESNPLTTKKFLGCWGPCQTPT